MTLVMTRDLFDQGPSRERLVRMRRRVIAPGPRELRRIQNPQHPTHGPRCRRRAAKELRNYAEGKLTTFPPRPKHQTSSRCRRPWPSRYRRPIICSRGDEFVRGRVQYVANIPMGRLGDGAPANGELLFIRRPALGLPGWRWSTWIQTSGLRRLRRPKSPGPWTRHPKGHRNCGTGTTRHYMQSKNAFGRTPPSSTQPTFR